MCAACFSSYRRYAGSLSVVDDVDVVECVGRKVSVNTRAMSAVGQSCRGFSFLAQFSGPLAVCIDYWAGIRAASRTSELERRQGKTAGLD